MDPEYLSRKTHRTWLWMPARAGVIVNSVLGVLLGGGVAGLGWFMLFGTMKETTCDPLDRSWGCTTRDKRTALWIATALVHTFLLMISIMGFVASVWRRRDLASAYMNLVVFHFIASIAVGIATAVLYVMVYLQPLKFTIPVIALAVARVVVWLWDAVICVPAYRFVRQIDYDSRAEPPLKSLALSEKAGRPELKLVTSGSRFSV